MGSHSTYIVYGLGARATVGVVSPDGVAEGISTEAMDVLTLPAIFVI